MYAWKVIVNVNQENNFVAVLTVDKKMSGVIETFERHFKKTPFEIIDIEFIGSVINGKGKMIQDNDYILPSFNLKQLERNAILLALKQYNGRQNLAAEKLDISPRRLNYKIHTIHQIKEYQWRKKR